MAVAAGAAAVGGKENKLPRRLAGGNQERKIIHLYLEEDSQEKKKEKHINSLSKVQVKKTVSKRTTVHATWQSCNQLQKQKKKDTKTGNGAILFSIFLKNFFIPDSIQSPLVSTWCVQGGRNGAVNWSYWKDYLVVDWAHNHNLLKKGERDSECKWSGSNRSIEEGGGEISAHITHICSFGLTPNAIVRWRSTSYT